MTDEEILLPLHRDFTDKEKADWYHQDLLRCKTHNQGLEKAVKKFKAEIELLRQERNRLAAENEKLKADLEKWIAIPKIS